MPQHGHALEELADISLHEQKKHHKGKHPGQIGAHRAGEFRPFSLVGLRQKIAPAPAAAAGAEQQHNQRPERKHVVADKKIFQIHNNTALAERSDSRPYVKAQNTGHHEQGQQHAVYGNGFFPAPAPHVHTVGNDVFHHADHGGQRGAAHEHEEQTAPQRAHGHLIKNIGQGDEYQAGAAVRLHAKGKTGREDNQAGSQGHKGIQPHDKHGFTGQAAPVIQVTAEDHHAAHADGQGEKGLVHGRADHVKNARLLHPGEIGRKIKGNALRRSVQSQGPHSQPQHDDKQAQHHILDHRFQPSAHAHAAHAE